MVAEQLDIEAPPLPAEFVARWRELERAAGLTRPATLVASECIENAFGLWLIVRVNGRGWARLSSVGAAEAADAIFREWRERWA